MTKFLFEYAGRPGQIQRLDPLPKLVFVLVMYIILFSLEDPLTIFALLLTFILLLYFGARVALTEYWQLLAVFIPFFIIVAVMQGLLYRPEGGGNAVMQGIGDLQFTQEGLLRGVALATRLAAAGVSFLIFSMTTTPIQIEQMLLRLKAPYKAAYLLGFAFRYIDLIQEEILDLRNAAAVRGQHFKLGNPVDGIRLGQLLMAPLLISVFRRSLGIALAMELRAWERSNQRTQLHHLRMKPVDYLLTVAALALLLGFWLYRVLL